MKSKTRKPTVKTKPTIETNYLSSIYHVERFSNTVLTAVKSLQEFRKKQPFDAIAFTGCSGAALAYTLSYKLKVPLICVRKRTRSSHYDDIIEGCVSAKNYIIVDDIVDTGRTISRIKREVSKVLPAKTKLVGIYLYNRGKYDFYDAAEHGTILINKLKV